MNLEGIGSHLLAFAIGLALGHFAALHPVWIAGIRTSFATWTGNLFTRSRTAQAVPDAPDTHPQAVAFTVGLPSASAEPSAPKSSEAKPRPAWVKT